MDRSKPWFATLHMADGSRVKSAGKPPQAVAGRAMLRGCAGRIPGSIPGPRASRGGILCNSFIWAETPPARPATPGRLYAGHGSSRAYPVSGWAGSIPAACAKGVLRYASMQPCKSQRSVTAGNRPAISCSHSSDG